MVWRRSWRRKQSEAIITLSNDKGHFHPVQVTKAIEKEIGKILFAKLLANFDELILISAENKKQQEMFLKMSNVLSNDCKLINVELNKIAYQCCLFLIILRSIWLVKLQSKGVYSSTFEVFQMPENGTYSLSSVQMEAEVCKMWRGAQVADTMKMLSLNAIIVEGSIVRLLLDVWYSLPFRHAPIPTLMSNCREWRHFHCFQTSHHSDMKSLI